MKQKDTENTLATQTAIANSSDNQPMDTGEKSFDWEIVYSYSRAQALADGVLVDATQLAREAGFRIPVALTSTAWASCVVVSPSDHVHDETGRLWDVLNVLRFTIKSQINSSQVFFCVDVADEQEKIERVQLKALCGPGDNAEPVLTIMLPDED